MSRDLQQLLRDTAARPSHPVDPSELVGRARRRTWATRAALGIVMVVAVAGAAFGLQQVVVTERAPEIVDQPEVPPPSPESAEKTEPGLPAEGVAVEVDGRVEFIGLDGTSHHGLPATTLLRDSGPVEQLRSPTHLIAISTDEQGELWLDLGTGSWQPADRSVPLRGDFEVVFNPDSDPSERYELHRGNTVLVTWPDSPVNWWLTPDHRVVSWEVCEDAGCVHQFLDTDSMDQPQDLADGCWVAHVLGDFAYTNICQDGRQLVRVTPSPDEPDPTFDVPQGTDGQPATAVAAYRDGIVRIDHATCQISQPMRIDDEQGLVPLLGDDPRSTPSAVPLGVTDGGQVVLHYNSAACDATAQDPGVYLYDPDTGDQQLIYEGHLQTGQAQMWTRNHVGITTPQQTPDQPTAAAHGCTNDPEHLQDATGEIAVYFQCDHRIDLLHAQPRPAPDGELEAQLSYAVTQFAQGPSEGERERGYTTVFPGDPTLLAGVDYLQDSSTVVASFDPAIREVNNLGTAGVSLPFIDGLRATVFQFDAVETLRIEIDGECWPIDPLGRCTFQDET